MFKDDRSGRDLSFGPQIRTKSYLELNVDRQEEIKGKTERSDCRGKQGLHGEWGVPERVWDVHVCARVCGSRARTRNVSLSI
jgi:hypothetical protein